MKRQKKIVYKYNEITHKINAKTIYEDPRQPGVFSIPVGCTEEAPPEPKEFKAILPDGKGWKVVDDFRKKIYYDTQTKQQVKIYNIGEQPAEGWTELAPGPFDIWNGSRWQYDKELELQYILNQRQQAYFSEADPLKAEAEYDAIINKKEPNYSKWIAKQKEIRNKFPKP